jgi:hypothetical protein
MIEKGLFRLSAARRKEVYNGLVGKLGGLSS